VIIVRNSKSQRIAEHLYGLFEIHDVRGATAPSSPGSEGVTLQMPNLVMAP